jgi:DNA-directed RNA polymerase
LAINGANKYGYDKDDYNGRVRWVMDNRESIRAVVADPTGSSSRSFLAGADKPFQFAAFCFEWAKCGYGTNPESVSHLPVGLDGSCNGLQHYGAMLRDVRGGKGVNLTDAKVPEDIYREVSDEFRRLLERDSGNPLAAQVLSLNPDRKCAKRPVMTLPYGSTQQSCRQYLFDWIEGENGTAAQLESRKLATYATPIMWEAIGNVVVAAREAMRWLQDASTVVARKGVYARWMSPADFPVYQHYSEYDTIRVRTDLFGKINILIQGSPCGVAKRKARNGVAPNFVHAMDASHMVLTILDAKARGIGSLAMIHDDFGTHASDIPELNEIIRQTFVRMYYDTNWLAKWRMEIQRLDDTLELPEPPEMGTLDVLDVLDSKYFFG